MIPAKLIGKLQSKGVHVSHNGDSLNFWPVRLVSPTDVDDIKRMKIHLIGYLKGTYQIERGHPVSCEFGNQNVWEIYPEHDRIGLIDDTGLKRFFSYNEIGSLRRFEFRRRRFKYIEGHVYSHPRQKWAEVFARFRPEWDFLFRELNREQHLLETFCGPISQVDSLTYEAVANVS